MSSEPTWIVVPANGGKCYEIHSVDFVSVSCGEQVPVVICEQLAKEEAEAICRELNRCGADPRRMMWGATLSDESPELKVDIDLVKLRRFAQTCMTLLKSRTEDHFDDAGFNHATLGRAELEEAERYLRILESDTGETL